MSISLMGVNVVEYCLWVVCCVTCVLRFILSFSDCCRVLLLACWQNLPSHPSLTVYKKGFQHCNNDSAHLPLLFQLQLELPLLLRSLMSYREIRVRHHHLLETHLMCLLSSQQTPHSTRTQECLMLIHQCPRHLLLTQAQVVHLFLPHSKISEDLLWCQCILHLNPMIPIR